MLFAMDFTRSMGDWVKEHKALKKALPNGKWLFEMYAKRNDRFVIVSLRDLNYTYYAKFIETDVEDYCLKLLRVIEPKVFNLISIEIEPYTLRYEFMTREGMFVKNVPYSFASMIY